MRFRCLGWFNPFHRKSFYVLALSCSTVLMAACNVSDTTILTQIAIQTLSTASNTTQGDIHQLVIKADSYLPVTLNIEPGDTVTWVNKDIRAHTVTSIRHFQDEDDLTHIFIGETWDSGDLGPGQSFSRTFTQSGTYEYLSLPLHTPLPFLQYYDFIAHTIVGRVVVA
jgi:plastocyanin